VKVRDYKLAKSESQKLQAGQKVKVRNYTTLNNVQHIPSILPLARDFIQVLYPCKWLLQALHYWHRVSEPISLVNLIDKLVLITVNNPHYSTVYGDLSRSCPDTTQRDNTAGNNRQRDRKSAVRCSASDGSFNKCFYSENCTCVLVPHPHQTPNIKLCHIIDCIIFSWITFDVKLGIFHQIELCAHGTSMHYDQWNLNLFLNLSLIPAHTFTYITS
jgi:hypothetical protein